MGHVGSKSRSLGQSLNHSPEDLGERLQGHHGPLVSFECTDFESRKHFGKIIKAGIKQEHADKVR